MGQDHDRRTKRARARKYIKRWKERQKEAAKNAAARPKVKEKPAPPPAAAAAESLPNEEPQAIQPTEPQPPAGEVPPQTETQA